MSIDVSSYRKRVARAQRRLSTERELIRGRRGVASTQTLRRNLERSKAARRALDILELYEEAREEAKKSGVKKTKLERALQKSLISQLSVLSGDGGRRQKRKAVAR